MAKHFGFKVKRPIGYVQIWTPSLLAWLQSFQFLVKYESTWNFLLRLILLFNLKNLGLLMHRGQNQTKGNKTILQWMPHPRQSICTVEGQWSQCNWMGKKEGFNKIWYIAIWGKVNVEDTQTNGGEACWFYFV